MATKQPEPASSDPTHSPPLQDRLAIVTGSSRGIGREIALHLASLGARVVVNYSSNSSLADSVVAQINSIATSTAAAPPPQAIAVKANVSDPDDVKSLFDSAERAFDSPIHILVNSAGILDGTYPTIANTAVETFDKILAVNARGAFLCAREAARRVKRGGGGRIVLVTSTLVAALTPGYGSYTSSKAAVEAMTKILAKELRGTGITANCVAPGPIATEMFFEGKSEEVVEKIKSQCPFERLGEVKDVAPVVGFLVSDAGEWVNGQVIRVNGGFVV